jgi:leucyl-tRNA synthetase
VTKFGGAIDWRRSFLTTDKNPYFDSFVRWQYNTMRKLGKVDFGKRACVFSIRDGQPCADHDRQSGEGVGVQEFTLIKMRVTEWSPLAPADVVSRLAGKNVFCVAGTLRPETMYGQTNFWVSPEGTYGVYEMRDDEYFVCGAWSALNMAFQDRSATPNTTPTPIVTLKGSQLIGTQVLAPLAERPIYGLPLLTVKMDRATGIVTSVPSDAPDDYAGLMDLKNKAALREKFGVKDEWVLPFSPVPIIDTPGFGNLAAVKACEVHGIKSQNDRDALQKAKDEVYLKGFYEGTMLVGDHAGKKVADAKPLIRAALISAGLAATYSEPEKPVMSRSGEQCIVALADQWYIKYGEPSWKAQAEEALAGIECFAPDTRNQFARTLDWLNQWACSRSYGLGTRLPFDTKFLVESLSDSTIYMAYYTVSHLLHGGNFDGSAPGPLGITPDQCDDAFWDHILLNTPVAPSCKIAAPALAQLRNEFEYWYGVDLRVSGKDLVPNHLTFFIYAHTAIFPKDKWPKGIRANGHILLNNEKMSKATGNFMTLNDACDQYSTSALRVALANAGDSLDDANFEDEVANAAILKLHVLMAFVGEVKGIKAGHHAEGAPKARYGPAETYAEKLFENGINSAINLTRKAYDNFLFRDALTEGFFNFQAELNNYRSFVEATAGEALNLTLIDRWIEAQCIMLTPIAPHITEHIWRHLLGKTTSVYLAGWPHAEPGNPVLIRVGSYLERVTKLFRSRKGLFLEPKKGSKGAAAAAPVDPKTAKIAGSIWVAKTFPTWQAQIIAILRGLYNPATKAIEGDVPGALKAAKFENIVERKPGDFFKKAMQFASFMIKEEFALRGVEALEASLPFDEEEVLGQVAGYLTTTLGLSSLAIYQQNLADDSEETRATPGGPLINFEVVATAMDTN